RGRRTWYRPRGARPRVRSGVLDHIERLRTRPRHRAPRGREVGRHARAHEPSGGRYDGHDHVPGRLGGGGYVMRLTPVLGGLYDHSHPWGRLGAILREEHRAHIPRGFWVSDTRRWMGHIGSGGGSLHRRAAGRHGGPEPRTRERARAL